MTTKRKCSAWRIPRGEGPQSIARLLLLGCIGWARAVAAQDQPTQEQTSAPTPPHSGDFWERDALAGDWGGWRGKFEDQGVILGADSIDEVFSNPVGGVKSGTIYEGRLELLTTIDLNKAVGLPNATFHANAYQIRGRGLSANYLGNNLMLVSNIEAARSLRLFDLWVEQILLDGKLSLRVGQIAADDEFFISQYSANLINATFGWPEIVSSDLPSGGPAYPLATPGARIKFVTGKFSLAAAVLDGDPAGPGPGNPQLRDASGTAFRIGDPPLTIGEFAYATNQEKDAAGLPASYKLGGWYHAGQFPDQRFDTTGQSLASPTSSGIPAQRNGNYGVYAVIDQGVWRDSEVHSRSAALFLRLSGAPSDRNLVAFYCDAGVNLQGAIPSRGNDLLAFGVAVARIGEQARALDRDARHFTGTATPVRDVEAAVELSYRAQVTPWWALQPDLQFIVHPTANVPPPGSPTRAVGNALVIGLRSAILF